MTPRQTEFRIAAGLLLLAVVGMAAAASVGSNSASEPVREVLWPLLKLNGCMNGGGRGMAILNGRATDVGGTVEGVELVEVVGQKATLRFRGQTLTLGQGQTTAQVSERDAAAPQAVPAETPATALPAAPADRTGLSASAAPPPPAATNQTAWGDVMQGWIADQERLMRGPAGMRKRAEPALGSTPPTQGVRSMPPSPAPTAVPTPAGGKPLSLEEQAIAEHLNAPGMMERIHAEIRSRQAEGQRQRHHPHIAPTGDIFFSRPNELIYYDRMAGRAGRPLDVMDAFNGNIDPSMLLIGKFVMETLQALERDGTQGGLRFATDFIASHVRRREEIVRTWDGLDFVLVEIGWLTAGAQDVTGDKAGARKTIRQALELDPGHTRAWSLRYMDARAASGEGLDFEASEILQKLAEDPVSKRMPLTLPGEAPQRGTVYAESVVLLARIRDQGPGGERRKGEGGLP